MNDLNEIYGVINDFWKFYKAHHVIENTDAYWKSVCDESAQIVSAHKSSQFAKDMCYAMLSHLANEDLRLKNNHRKGEVA